LPELYFDLHECHAFRNDRQGNESVAEVGADFIHRMVIDLVNPRGELVRAF